MSYQEKQSVVNILSGLAITAVYGWTVYQDHLAGQYDLAEDFQKWGVLFLIFMGVSIVARIIIHIIFHIINAIATRTEDVPDEDERDKLIKLKATRNSHYAFSLPFAGAFVGLALGMQIHWIFITFIVSGLLSEIVENLSQLYYYRKGI
ncbi:MAG: hypothetical protein U9N86_04520 [Bacteroidota bacterium]|nr:hypothetical protein [Bacteroidota bacterium]